MPSLPAPDHPLIVRAEIALGTLVEIALPADDATDARFAAAFAAIAHVHRTMSAHDPASDLALIADAAHRRAVVVDRQTCAVLEIALAMHRETRGAFDVTVAPEPGYVGSTGECAAKMRARRGGMAAVILESGNRVRTAVPIRLDLGGIAKGYAVDRAVDALRATGARQGIVNAGGDLRAFGSGQWTPVRVRHSADPALVTVLFDVRDAAVATSADYFRSAPGALLDPRSRCIRAFGGSVTVVAPTCALADALTKVVALDPCHAPEILGQYGAQAFHLDVGADGVRVRTTYRATTARLRVPAALVA